VAKNISDNVEVSSISFKETQPSTIPIVAQQYLEMRFSSTRAYWRVDIYTDNKTAMTGYQKGGLLNTTTNTILLPLAWKVFDEVQSSTPPAGDPNSDSGWHYLKDKNDEDDPKTPNDDESWKGAWEKGYTTVVSGNYDNSKLPNGISCNSPVYLYIEGLFNNVAAGKYSGTIWFDLYDVSDISPPEISHSPMEKIGIIGDNIVINAKITDDQKVEYANLHYKINDGDWQVRVMNLEGVLPYSKDAYAVICSTEVKIGKIYYTIEACDGCNRKFWKPIDNPQLLEISQETVFKNVLSGRFVVPDGNPYDGSVILDIPEGALSEPIDITVIQRNLDDNIPEGNGACATKKPVAVYEFKPHNLLFKKPISITLPYFDLNNNGKVELLDGTETEIDESKLSIFWWDGFDWRLVGGSKVDKLANTISAKITHFSLYGIFPTKPLTAEDYRPKERIITPASVDGINDFVTFDGLFDEYEINIYDITGRKIITITSDNPSGPKWDGRDAMGNVVESGVYIYQFKAKVGDEIKLISGTIVVAK